MIYKLLETNIDCTSTNAVCADKTLPIQDQIGKVNELRCSLHKGTVVPPDYHRYFYGPKIDHIQVRIITNKKQKRVLILPNSNSKYLSLDSVNVYLHMLNCGISNGKSCMPWFSCMLICTIFKFLDPVYTIRCHRTERKFSVAIKCP